MINLIMARTLDNVIGVNCTEHDINPVTHLAGNQLPWSYQKSDMTRFKQLTSNNIVIMGRKTYESIGKPLPNRRNIVLTSKSIQNLPDKDFIMTFDDLKLAIDWCKQKPKDIETFIIGGAQIYQTALEENLVDRIYLTNIGTTINPKYSDSLIYGFDTKFLDNFKLKSQDIFVSDSYNKFSYSFETYIKTKTHD